MPAELMIPALIFVVASLCFIAGMVMYRIHVNTVRVHTEPVANGRARESGGAQSIDGDQVVAMHPPAEVKRILTAWFEGKVCAHCQRPIPPTQSWSLRMKPGVLHPESGEILSWDQLLSAGVPALLESSVPLCENCCLAESFRKQYPTLVTDRGHTDLRARDVH